MNTKALITRIFLMSRPLVEWIDKTFTDKHAIKKVTGDHYYLWRDDIFKSMVFLTNVNGVGSNLINPSEINHAAIYFGRGLKTAINDLITRLESILPAMSNVKEIEKVKSKINRLVDTSSKYNVSDDICYVIEATGHGVHPTNLVKFLTTKDLVLALSLKTMTQAEKNEAAITALNDLGLPYDYGFSDGPDKKYCFEVVASAYESIGVKLNKVVYKFFGFEIYDVFLSDTFLKDDRWERVIDSRDFQ